MKYLIVGLGNIGPEYQNTRHNIGFKVLDALAKASNAVFEDRRYGARAEVSYRGRTLVLLKPNTYMNLSGRSVSYWKQKEKVELSHILIVADDLALPFGSVRLRAQGSAGGHNGLKSINEWLTSQEYARLRFGIGDNFRPGNQVNYVLGKWNPEEKEALPGLLDHSVAAIECFVASGIVEAMNRYNLKV